MSGGNKMTIRFCKKCGFILGTRPGMLDQGGGMSALHK